MLAFKIIVMALVALAAVTGAGWLIAEQSFKAKTPVAEFLWSVLGPVVFGLAFGIPFYFWGVTWGLA